MAESTQTPTKRRGRPPKNVVKMPQTSPSEPQTPDQDPDEPPEPDPEPRAAVTVSAKPFPLPPKGRGKGQFCEAEEGLAYWRGLAPELINRCNVYINREWPILDRLQELSP